MAGIPLWHGKVFRPVGLMVKDCGLFPESPLRRDRQDRNLFLLESLWVLLRSIRYNIHQLCRCPGRQRSNLQPNNLQGRGIGKQVWISKDHRLFIFLVYVKIGRKSQFIRKPFSDLRAESFCQENFGFSVRLFIEGILFGV